MTSDHKRGPDEILEEALDVASADVPAFLDEACNGDATLREEVERLLEVHRRRGAEFMGSAASSWVAPRFERGQRIGRYEIETRMGSGGMSVVYRARDLGILRPVAIKVLFPSGAENVDSNRRFIDEVRTLGSINHPNVVQVFDYGELEGLPYIVMECLEGDDLATVIAGGRCGDLQWRLTVARQLAAALEHVHRAGIIHRDIKPANLFIQRSGPVKLMDFGIARSAQPKSAHATALIGTPEYLAPEQVKGESASTRSDIYSYGILLFELFTGQKPFSGNTAEVLYKVVHEEVPADILDRSGLPRSVSKLIRSATRKNPAHRPGSFEEIGKALLAVTGEPQGNRKARRWTLVAVALAVAFVLALSVLPRQSPGGRRGDDGPPSPVATREAPPVMSRPETKAPPAAPGAPAAPATPESAKRGSRPPTREAVLSVRGVDRGGDNPNSVTANGIRFDEPPPLQPIKPKVPVLSTPLPMQTADRPSAPARSDGPLPAPAQGPAVATGQEVETARVEPRTADANAILSVLRAYADAYSSKDIEAVAGIRDLNAEQRRGIRRSFSENLRVTMSITPVSKPRFEAAPPGARAGLAPDRAVVVIDVTIRVQPNNGEAAVQTRATVTVKLTRVGGSWRISSWD